MAVPSMVKENAFVSPLLRFDAGTTSGLASLHDVTDRLRPSVFIIATVVEPDRPAKSGPGKITAATEDDLLFTHPNTTSRLVLPLWNTSDVTERPSSEPTIAVP
jgi:hypothetical protein